MLKGLTRLGGGIIALFLVTASGLAIPGVAAASSLSFDGSDDYVAIPDTFGNFDFNNAFTVEAWVNPSALGIQPTFKGIVQGASTEPPFTSGGWVMTLQRNLG